MSVARDSSTTFPYNLYGVDDPLGLPPDRSHSQRQDTDKNSHCQAARRFGWISSDKQTNNGRNDAPSFPHLVLLFLDSLWCCSLVVLYTHATVLTYARYSLSLPIDYTLVHLETFQISVAPVCPVIVITVCLCQCDDCPQEMTTRLHTHPGHDKTLFGAWNFPLYQSRRSALRYHPEEESANRR